MRLHRQLLGGAVLLVVLFGGVSHADDLRSLLGVWKFEFSVEDKDVSYFIFLDDILTEKGETLVTGMSMMGLPVIADKRREKSITRRSPYQYYVAWEEPPGTGTWMTFVFNFVTPNSVAGEVWIVQIGDNKRSSYTVVSGSRVCQHGEPCAYR